VCKAETLAFAVYIIAGEMVILKFKIYKSPDTSQTLAKLYEVLSWVVLNMR